jgi:hypothetical protein
MQSSTDNIETATAEQVRAMFFAHLAPLVAERGYTRATLLEMIEGFGWIVALAPMDMSHMADECAALAALLSCYAKS